MTASLIFLLLCLSGALGCLFVPDRRTPEVIAIVGSIAGAALLTAAMRGLASSTPASLSLWNIAQVGTLKLALDQTSAWFLLVSGLIFVPVSVYSANYLRRYSPQYALRPFGVVYFALLASIALTLLAADILSLLIAWELMSVLSYFIVNYEHLHEHNTRAGFVMLAAGEAGMLPIVVALLLLATHAGGDAFSAIRSAPALGTHAAWAVFLLSFFGFGVKAGLFPSMSWLPRAHPAAPANASALLSAVILDLGIYGIVRVNLDLAPVSTSGPGVIVLLVGAVSAIIGILYATTENDLKRMLAHSSIENLGLIAVGLGAAMIFHAAALPALAGIALIAALFHMLNHSLYKGLLFLGAGAVDSAVGTRDMNELGGLARVMPWTGACFLVGCLSISALPPFNGFPSEWLTMQSLLRSAELGSPALRMAFAIAGALVALTAGLAVTAFIKLFAMSFLGIARSSATIRAREVGRSMIGAMVALALLCLFAGIASTYIVKALGPVADLLGGADSAAAVVPPFFSPASLPAAFVADFHQIGAQSGARLLPAPGLVLLHRTGPANTVVAFAAAPAYLGLALASAVLLLWIIVAMCGRRRRRQRAAVWSGGLARLRPQFTYSATGFSQPARVIFRAILAPTQPVQNEQVVAEHFRMAIYRTHTEAYALDRWLFVPLLSATRALAQWLARLHHGQLNAYIGYALATLLVVAALVYLC